MVIARPTCLEALNQSAFLYFIKELEKNAYNFKVNSYQHFSTKASL